ncbi:MAG TPA: hypothetical protein VG965_00760 [Patescibacteria group bacterium]|nr:hypothetical protein [Patescibacteria group bacterium]
MKYMQMMRYSILVIFVGIVCFLAGFVFASSTHASSIEISRADAASYTAEP